jgi:hypothetical protein
VTPVMRMLTAARGAVPGLAPGRPNVEYVAMDGTLHAVPPADAARVRLTDMQPSRRFKARKRQRNELHPGGGGAAGERNTCVIPQDVKIVVTLRDQGRCVQGGSTQDLHYDHKIP